MKEWIKRWLSTPPLYDPATLFDKLQEAHSAHISDLRVLIDKGHEREAVLVSTIQQIAIQPKAQRANAADRTENKSEPIIPLESLTDVAGFDESADAADLEKHDALTKEMEAKYRELFEEQTVEGIHKP